MRLLMLLGFLLLGYNASAQSIFRDTLKIVEYAIKANTLEKYDVAFEKTGPDTNYYRRYIYLNPDKTIYWIEDPTYPVYTVYSYNDKRKARAYHIKASKTGKSITYTSLIDGKKLFSASLDPKDTFRMMPFFYKLQNYEKVAYYYTGDTTLSISGEQYEFHVIKLVIQIEELLQYHVYFYFEKNTLVPVLTLTDVTVLKAAGANEGKPNKTHTIEDSFIEEPFFNRGSPLMNFYRSRLIKK